MKLHSIYVLYLHYLFIPLWNRLAESVRLMMALSIFLSYALQFYVPMDIMWPAIKSRIPTERMQLISEYAFRTLLVIFSCKFLNDLEVSDLIYHVYRDMDEGGFV